MNLIGLRELTRFVVVLSHSRGDVGRFWPWCLDDRINRCHFAGREPSHPIFRTTCVRSPHSSSCIAPSQPGRGSRRYQITTEGLEDKDKFGKESARARQEPLGWRIDHPHKNWQRKLLKVTPASTRYFWSCCSTMADVVLLSPLRS